MDIQIINLPRYNSISVTREDRCEFISGDRIDTPTTLLIIAALLKQKGHKIFFIDANANNLNFEYLSKIITNRKISCVIFTFNARIIDYDLKICDIIKEINSSCITIGYSFYSKYFAKEIMNEFKNLDIQILDSPFSIIDKLIDSISKNHIPHDINGIAYRDENKKIKINNKIGPEIGCEKFTLPAYELLSSFGHYWLINKFISPYALMYTATGCPFECSYCTSAKSGYAGKSSELIIQELEILTRRNVKFVYFFDHVFTLNKKRVADICKLILEKDIGIKWFCDTRVDLVDEELLKIMKKAGCIGIAYGIESASDKIHINMKKGNTVLQAKKAIEWTHKAHIPIFVHLILGLIGENNDTLKENELFISTTLPEVLSIHSFGAYAGTEFGQFAMENKWIDEKITWKEQMKGHFNNKYYDSSFDSEWEIKIKKMLYSNPKWWMTCIKSLFWNPELLVPSVYEFRKNFLILMKRNKL